jgi:hypothetical protein
MSQAVSRRPPTAEARFLSRVSPCGICGGQSGTGKGFSPNTSAFRCQFHSTGALLLGKGQKIIIVIVIFITGLHNKPQGCGASVASATGPFTTKITIVSDVTWSLTRLASYVCWLRMKGSSQRQELQVTAFVSWFSSQSWFRTGLSLMQTSGKTRRIRRSRRD